MSTAPATSASPATARNQALYRNLVQEASAGGAGLMGKLVAAARLVLQNQEAAARDLRQRDALAESANQLRQCEQQLCKTYPAALLRAFVDPEVGKKSSNLTVAEVQFDQLELMDDAQVLTSVTMARIQQGAMQAAEASLAELNTLMCSVLGMSAVRADVNPLRPEAYVNALKETLEQTQATPATQLQWCNAMSVTLGLELRALYVGLCSRMRQDGVVSVAYSMPAGVMHSGNDAMAAAPPAAPGAAGPARPPAIAVRARDETLLTLDKLRNLLSGEPVTATTGSRMEQFAAQFARQFEDAPGEPANTDFDATVPAALEALTEMKQVERVVQSLEQRRGKHSGQTAPQAHSVEAQRLDMRRQARDTAQALSLEVVTLMVENIAHDPRLLEPVRQVSAIWSPRCCAWPWWTRVFLATSSILRASCCKT